MTDVPQTQPPESKEPQPAIRAMPPSAAPPVMPDLYARIGMVRENAVKHFGGAQKLTQIAAVIMLLICFLNLVVVALMVPALGFRSVSGTGAPSFGNSVILLIVYAIFVTLLIALGIYSVRVLIDLPRLFVRHYELTLQQLQTTSLALLIAQEGYWLRIQQQLNEWTVLRREGHSIYHTLEEHLSYCACHRDTLLTIGRGVDRIPILLLKRGQQCYFSRKLFQQQAWVYWTCGCLLFLFMRVGVIAAAAVVLIGSRYVISRAALVAYCDFILDEQPVTDAS